MKGDLLEKSTRALREHIDGSCEDARVAEDEFIARLPRARRIRFVRPWGLAFAALFIGSSVWATTSGPLAPWFERVTSTDVEAPAAPVVVARPGSLAPTSEQEILAADEDVAEAPHASEVRAVAPSSSRHDSKTTSSAPNSPDSGAIEVPAPAPTSSATLDVYEEAHELHFVRGDYARALTAWDRYLAMAPTGALALEARFHRAVCLVRTGSQDAARTALEPFARGNYGTYRREQARKLLGEMGEKLP